MESLELHDSCFQFNDDEFYEVCQQNGDLKLERDTNGTILIGPIQAEELEIETSRCISR